MSDGLSGNLDGKFCRKQLAYIGNIWDSMAMRIYGTKEGEGYTLGSLYTLWIQVRIEYAEHKRQQVRGG